MYNVFTRLIENQTISNSSDIDKRKHGISLLQRISESLVGRKVILDFLNARADEIKLS